MTKLVAAFVEVPLPKDALALPPAVVFRLNAEDAKRPDACEFAPDAKLAIPRFARTFNPFAKEDKPAENEDIPSALLPSPKLRAKLCYKPIL